MAGIEGQPIPDSRPPGSGGVTQGQLDEQTQLMLLVDESIVALHKSLAEARNSVNTLASWSNFFTTLVTVIETAVPLLQRSAEQGTTQLEKMSFRNQILKGVLEVWNTPKENRAAVATELAKGLLRGLI
ncbi:MAG TPA: hypothetical protein PLF34_07800 [Candidatus Hydrothermia bacterium]|nr:hypothetical protein [Candidatus Hydrothermia bacterium]